MPDLAQVRHSLIRNLRDGDPTNFCKIVASLLPRQLDLSLEVSAAEFAVTFRSALQAIEALGNEPPSVSRRRPKAIEKVIEAEVIDATAD
jgi:hypothetical protein